MLLSPLLPFHLVPHQRGNGLGSKKRERKSGGTALGAVHNMCSACAPQLLLLKEQCTQTHLPWAVHRQYKHTTTGANHSAALTIDRDDPKKKRRELQPANSLTTCCWPQYLLAHEHYLYRASTSIVRTNRVGLSVCLCLCVHYHRVGKW